MYSPSRSPLPPPSLPDPSGDWRSIEDLYLWDSQICISVLYSYEWKCWGYSAHVVFDLVDIIGCLEYLYPFPTKLCIWVPVALHRHFHLVLLGCFKSFKWCIYWNLNLAFKSWVAQLSHSFIGVLWNPKYMSFLGFLYYKYFSCFETCFFTSVVFFDEQHLSILMKSDLSILYSVFFVCLIKSLRFYKFVIWVLAKTSQDESLWRWSLCLWF